MPPPRESRGSALPTASFFLSGFVGASSPYKTSEFGKQAQLQSIQNKLSRKPKEKTRSCTRAGTEAGVGSRDKSRDKSIMKAERVEAKMKLQLSKTAVEHDARLVKNIGQSFRFSAKDSAIVLAKHQGSWGESPS